MDVLSIAFLSSAALEFFATVGVAMSRSISASICWDGLALARR